jgi:hypothetical protein
MPAREKHRRTRMNVDEFFDHELDEHTAVLATTRIQEMHITPRQMLRAGLKRELGLA